MASGGKTVAAEPVQSSAFQANQNHINDRSVGWLVAILIDNSPPDSSISLSSVV